MKLSNLHNDLLMIRIYAVLFVFNLLIVLPYSIKAINAFNKRNELKSDLTNIKIDMETKLEQLRQSSIVYSEALTYKKDLDIALPSNNDVQNYLVSLVESISGVGYVLTDLTVDFREEKGEIFINLEMEGSPSNIGSVIDVLESLPRITEIQDIAVSFNELDDISMVVKVFVVEAGN